MATLIIIRGNSGSGKSTVAKRLQHEIGRNTLLIPQDMVRREMLWAEDGHDTAAIPLLCSLLEYGSRHCSVTILEGILKASWYEPVFVRAKELFGERIFAYYFDLPFAETLRRHATRTKQLEFGETEMRGWWNEKDYIGHIHETPLTENMTAEEIVSSILSDSAQN